MKFSNFVKSRKITSIMLILIMISPFLYFVTQKNQNIFNLLPYFSNFLNSNIKDPLKENPLTTKSSGVGFTDGSSGNLDTLLYLNLSQQISSCNTSTDFSINTNGWNISKTNLIFTNITGQLTKNIETSTTNDQRLNKLQAMPFRIDRIGYLQKINVSLKLETLRSGIDLKLYIYNKSTGLTPYSYFYYQEYDLDGNSTGWIELPLSTSVLLDPANTYNETFFIVLGQYTTTSTHIDWYYLSGGSAYEGTNTIYPPFSWTSVARNFTLSLTMETNFWPSERNLTVNGTAVTNLQIGNGSWNSTNLYTGANIFFNVEGTISLRYDVNWTCQFINNTFSNTYYIANTNNSIINWNTSISTLFHSNSFARGMNVTIPTDWNVSKVLKMSTPYSFWANYSESGKKIVNIWDVSNSTWLVNCNGSNWVGNIHIYNNTDLKEAYNYYLNDTILINGSILINSPINANLTIFDPENKTVHTDQASIINNNASFSPWQIIQNSTRMGTYYIQITWCNGTEVGINTTTIYCFNEPTNLTKTEGPDPGTVLKDYPVTAKVFYNDTYNNKGISGAIIQGNWSLPSMSFTDWGNGSYNITFQTTFASNSSYTVMVNATKDGYNLATTIIKFNVTIIIVEKPTELLLVGSIPSTGDPIYVNDTTKFVILNYINKSDSAGIKGANIMTDPDWALPYFQAEDLSLINSSQAGLYKIYLDTSGTHADEWHNITFSAVKEGYEVAFNYTQAFQIDPIPTAIDVTGYENITKFEGETVSIAAYYKDNYHSGNPAIINAQVNWTLNSTIYDTMQLNIVIYEGIINLPELAISPGTYNVTIRAQAPDFQFMSRNITLNVLPKWNTTIWIYNYSSDLRVGKDVTIIAVIEFSNSSIDRNGLKLSYDINYSDATHYSDFRITNSSGMITLTINPIPNITWINITISYEGTPQIHANSSWYLINILPKYATNITIFDSHLGSFIISGELININATLVYNNSGIWTPFPRENIEFIIDYENYEDDSLLIITDQVGNATLQFIPVVSATSVIIRAIYSGNSSFSSITQNSNQFIITKHNLTIILYDIHQLEVMVGSPLLLSCKVINTETGLPVANLTITFFVYLGSPDMRLMSQSAVTNVDGIATTALIMLQSFEVLPLLSIGVEYVGDDSTTTTSITSSLPIIPMSTMKYFTTFVMEYIWPIIVAIGAVSSLTGYKTWKYLQNRGWKKKIDHLFIISESGLPLKNWKVGGQTMDFALISGALSGVSSIVREMTKSVKKLSSIDHEDKKLLFSYGKFVIGVMVTHRDQPIMHKKLSGLVNNFESKYFYYLSPFDGNLEYFTDADELLIDTFPFAVPESIQEKMKLIPDIIKKKKKIRELNIYAGQLIKENKIASAGNIYKQAAQIAVDISDVQEFEKFMINIENIRKRLSKFGVKYESKLSMSKKTKIQHTLKNNLSKIQKAIKSSDFLTAMKLTSENANYYLELDEPKLVLELLEKINEYSRNYQNKIKELKIKESTKKIKEKINTLKMKAIKNSEDKKFSKAAEYYNEAAIFAFKINDKESFQKYMDKVKEYKSTAEKDTFKKEKVKQQEILDKTVSEILAEVESAKLAGKNEEIVRLYLNIANIYKKLGDQEKYLYYVISAKEFSKKT